MPNIYIKRGLNNALTAVNPVLGSGEMVYITDNNTIVVGNGSGVFSSLSGINATPLTHTHSSSDITNFNSSVSGLLPTIANSGDNRVLTSTGSTVGINAESNLTFNGSLLNITGSGSFSSNLNLSNQTASTIASFDSSKNIVSLATATYPSLTELSYVKGVTSSIQTQIDTKASTSTTITAGSGLAGGGSLASNRTIDIGQGDGISVSADSIAVDSTVIRTTGVQTMSGAKTFSAQTVFSSGTAAAPGISILGDTDTGIGQISANGTNSLSIMTSGVEKLTVTSGGNLQIKSNAGSISTLFTYNENGGELVHYDDTQTAATLLDQCANSTRLLELINGSDLLLGLGGSNTTGSIRFMRAGFQEAMRISSSGNVTIGEANSSNCRLMIAGTSSNISAARATYEGTLQINENSLSSLQATGGIEFKASVYESGYGVKLCGYDNGSFVIGNRANSATWTERFVISQAGSVGIGTSSPADKVHISSTGNVSLRINSTTSNVAELTLYSGSNVGGLAQNSTSFFMSNLSSGGTIAISQVGAGNIISYTNGAERTRITSDGNVGIGTATVSYRLHVVGNASSNNSIGMYLNNTGGARSRIAFQDTAVTYAPDIGSVGNSITFDTVGTERLVIDGSGNSLFKGKVDITSGTTTGAQTHFYVRPANGGLGRDSQITLGCTFSNGWGGADYAARDAGAIRFGANGGSADPRDWSMRFLVADGPAGSDTPRECMRITAAGNVGIGTTSPGGKLVVAGSGEVVNGFANGGAGTTNYGVLGQATGAASNNTGVYVNSYNATNNFGVRIVNPSAGANNWAIYSDATAKSYFAGNTGIGVHPTYRFEVRGAGATSSTVSFYVSNSSAAALLYTRDDGGINTGTAAVSPYNNVTATAANMVVGSDGFLYRSTSSLRYKTQINDATHGLNEVLKLRSVTFKSQNDGNQIFGGLIAEEVDSAGLTEFVQYDNENRPDAIHYSNMVALLIKAIQEQQTQINELKNRLSILEGE